MPENESGSTGHDRDYSLNLCESFAWFDRDSWSWKTSQRCLVEGWATYSESFPRAGTMRNGIAYRRQASAPLTGGTGSSLFATPTATANQLCPSMKKWPSCRAMWPTPKTQDCRAAKYDRGKSNLGEEVYVSVPEATAEGGSLNPQWVEWLMGFPPEWTALSASETP